VIERLRALFDHGQLLERASRLIMHVLATDSLASARLQELAGRVVAIHINGISTTLYAAVSAEDLLLATQSAREPDVILAGSLADFAAFARARQGAQTVPAGKLQIQGDLATAQTLQRLLDELDLDWEALLAARIGDLAAHQIGRRVRQGFAWWRESRSAWAEDIPAYLQHERAWLPTPGQIENFAREGITLSSDVDRLAARIARLQARMRAPGSGEPTR